MIDYCGTTGDNTGLVWNAYGWLCQEAVKVSIKMAAHSVPFAHGRKATKIQMQTKRVQKPRC